MASMQAPEPRRWAGRAGVPPIGTVPRRFDDGFRQRLTTMAVIGSTSLGRLASISNTLRRPSAWPRACAIAEGCPDPDDRRLTRSMSLSLKRARLCLDCDCLTDELFCPWCDRDGTVPITGWFRPMDDGEVNAPRHGKTQPPAGRRWILVVQHHQRDLYRVLRQALAGKGVEVLYERRVGQRRRTTAGPAAEERRRGDRRRPRPSAVTYQAAAMAGPDSSSPPSADREPVRVARPRRQHPARV